MLPPPVLADITDWIERVAVVEGYNTNTYQAQDDPNVPIIRRHPSPFTGIDADVELRIQPNLEDLHIFRLEGNALHYEPLEHQPGQSDDAALNGSWSSRFTLSRRTYLTVSSQATLSTFNGAHIADVTLLQFDPAQTRRTYWLETSEAGITHELSHTWRIREAVGLMSSGTIYQPPTLDASGNLIQHEGLDYIEPYEETDLFKDFSDRATGDMLVLYQYAYNLYVLDFTQSPPRNIGPDKQAFLTVTPGYTYRFTPELSESTHAGVVIASAPPRDPDQRAVLSPTFLEEISYTRPFFNLIATASYTYGSVNPRLGYGPSMSGAVLAVGTPYHHGGWKNLSILANGSASYSSLLTGVGGAGTQLGLYVGDAEFRYSLNNWLGLLGGYEIRYATLTDSATYLPPFLQQLVFVGLQGYFTTNRDIPPLTQFVAPITPPS
jgi:hypothetical protein